MPTELYELSFAREERKYQGFALDESASILGGESLIEDITPRGRKAGLDRWCPPRLREIWKAPKVYGKVSPKHDCPGINLIYPAFSKRACDALADFLNPSGELLPLATDVGEYFFFHITKIIDALDQDRTICTRLASDPKRIVDIEEYAFIESMVSGVDIFRTVDLPINVIVSGRFVARVQECGLRGFRFTKMWPHPPGTKWRQSPEILT
jgi:hypothetical protein